MIAALAAAACAWLAWRPHAGQHQDAAARWLRDSAVVAVATMGVGFWAGVMAAVVLRMVVPRLESRDRSATQALDHILLSPLLRPWLTRAAYAGANADSPESARANAVSRSIRAACAAANSSRAPRSSAASCCRAAAMS